ncbi:MAG: hypothetical protein GXO91_06590 [FCB group bacterium]|nr:hypothetical protein [FCB group bacterium]
MTSYGRAVHRARTALNAGDFDTAVRESVRALSLKSDLDEGLSLLEAAFPAAVRQHEGRIAVIKNGDDEFKWDAVVKEYEQLQNLVSLLDGLNNSIKLRILDKAEIEDYASLLQFSLEKSADAHYQAGVRLSRETKKKNYRSAAVQFKIANRILPGFKDAAELYTQYRRKGMLVVALLPFENKSGKTRFGDIGETVTTGLIAAMIGDSSLNEFVQIVRHDKLELVINEQQLSESGMAGPASVELGNILEAQQIISGAITQIIISPPKHHKTNKRLKRSVVVDRVSYTGEDGKKHMRKIYGDVHARAVLHEVTAGATVMANYSLIDVETGQVLFTKNIEGNWQFSDTWATFSGDVRALNSEITALSRKKQLPIPSNEELVASATSNLEEQLWRSIKAALRTLQ